MYMLLVHPASLDDKSWLLDSGSPVEISDLQTAREMARDLVNNVEQSAACQLWYRETCHKRYVQVQYVEVVALTTVDVMI